MNNIEVAVIPVAGIGTRSYPMTKVLSKTMYPILNKPVLHYILEEVIAANIKDAIIVLNENQIEILKYFKDINNSYKEKFSKLNIHYVFQPIPIGIGDALMKSKTIINNRDFAVLLGDDLIMNDGTKTYGIGTLIDMYNKNNATYLGVKEVSYEETKKYGVVEINSNNKVIDLVEKPQVYPPSNKVLIGRYIFQNNIFDYLRVLKLDKENEIKITDAIRIMCKEHNIYARNIEGIRYDIGDMFEYIKANIEYGLNNKQISNSLREYIKNKLHEIM